jgi:hypothetical protein
LRDVQPVKIGPSGRLSSARGGYSWVKKSGSKLLDRCLHDAAIPDDVRAAGALVLLYGMQLSRVVELTTAHLHSPRPGVSVTGFSVTGFSVTGFSVTR